MAPKRGRGAAAASTSPPPARRGKRGAKQQQQQQQHDEDDEQQQQQDAAEQHEKDEEEEDDKSAKGKSAEGKKRAAEDDGEGEDEGDGTSGSDVRSNKRLARATTTKGAAAPPVTLPRAPQPATAVTLQTSAAPQAPRRRALFNPTLQELEDDPLTKLADAHWRGRDGARFDADVVLRVFHDELEPSRFAFPRLMLLEYSQYLERYLWPHFDPARASLAHVLSIVLMFNEKARERVAAFDVVTPADAPKFGGLFARILPEFFNAAHPPQVHSALVMFMIKCCQSLEHAVVRGEVLRLVSLTTWHTILDGRREEEFRAHPKLRKVWKQLNKQYEISDDAKLAVLKQQRSFLSSLIKRFHQVLATIRTTAPVDPAAVRYCDRVVELMIDLQSQLPTRRYSTIVLDDHQLLVTCRCSDLAKMREGALFRELLDRLEFYLGFEINNHTGAALIDAEMVELQTTSIVSLQRAVFKLYPDTMKQFSLAHVDAINSRPQLVAFFGGLDDAQLRAIAGILHLRTVDLDGVPYPRETLMEVLVRRNEKRASQIDAINATPLYPNEVLLWDPTSIKTDQYSGEHCLALPKLNLQFLTVHDYLLRNYNLFRLEANYEIREDIEEVVERLQPRLAIDGSTEFGGWARMGVKVHTLEINKVAKPSLGERKPSRVTADVTFSLGMYRDHIRREWEQLRQHDILFLITIRANDRSPTKYDRESGHSFAEHYGVVCVRGCELEAVIGGDGKPIEEWRLNDPSQRPAGDMRTLRVRLDTNQYQADLDAGRLGDADLYSTFNVLMRRRPHENNFKAVLETIRDLMQTDAVVPAWLHDVFLGYGDPGAAHYSKMATQQAELNMNDTFISADHVTASFPAHHVQFTTPPAQRQPPFQIQFTDQKATDGKPVVVAKPYKLPNRGPYPTDKAKSNAVPFTPTQIEAIRSGMSHGLTMIVGPPGTGKTDVAVQIISNLYHNNPEQHTLIITHSNQALNQIFEKVIHLDIDERHCLRLGRGEEELMTEKNFSKYGRVDYFLQKRVELLNEVDRLARSLDVVGDHAYTCETAGHFFQFHVQPRWDTYLKRLEAAENPTPRAVASLFPFHTYFSTAPQPLFPETVSLDEAKEIAHGCFDGHLRHLFHQLEEIRPFELLRGGSDRANYLLTKQAKIIAMTCTHAALKRRELVELAFKYDNIVIEEAAQILEVETFIPMLLQTPDDGVSRLKRVVLIGDHNQLPPVVKNMAFQRYGNMEQSLFARFVRLGVPTVDLDAQGRARPSLSKLYSWRYKGLGDLPIVHDKSFQTANAGFAFEKQLVDVGDFMGKGEVETSPHFYQNVGEAEYIVAVYQYMRLVGYPAEKISILTTYNGQKDLIVDVVQRRCAWNALFGRPAHISTVDRFQGQQNDYILLSLVRTRGVGHLRDARRLVVALSRARLGLYVFCRKQLFEDCVDLQPAFAVLNETPSKLRLTMGETFPTERAVGEAGAQTVDIEDVEQMGQFVHKMTQEQMKRVETAANEAYHLLLKQQREAAEKEAAAAAAAASDANGDEKEGGEIAADAMER